MKATISIRCSHRQRSRCYSSNLLASAVEAASRIRLPLVREAYAQVSVTIRAMSRKRRRAWKCSLTITSSLTLTPLHWAKITARSIKNALATLSEENRATATGNKHKKLVKFGRAVFEISRVDRDTNRHTNKHTYQNTSQPYRSEVIMENDILADVQEPRF